MYYIVYVCICTMHYILWTCWNCPKPFWPAENRPESPGEIRLQIGELRRDLWLKVLQPGGHLEELQHWKRWGSNHEIGRFNHEIWAFAIQIQ